MSDGFRRLWRGLNGFKSIFYHYLRFDGELWRIQLPMKMGKFVDPKKSKKNNVGIEVECGVCHVETGEKSRQTTS